jgi:hypothetical protein
MTFNVNEASFSQLKLSRFSWFHSPQEIRVVKAFIVKSRYTVVSTQFGPADSKNAVYQTPF